jgi:serine/threonine protein kinase
LAHNATARKRFEREARAAAAVVHPNVIPIFGVSQSKGQPLIVMPLISGKSLQAHVESHGPFETKDVVRIGMQIAAGLAAAHQQGLIHRDIKPANILLEQDVSRVVITDFGLARAADELAMTQTGWLAGTPHYMSPEQARGAAIDARSDLFSLGGVLYFIATGREPFRAEKPVAVLHKICNETAVPARQINSDIPHTLSDIIERLLEKNPNDRFHSAGRVQKLLEDYLAELQQPNRTNKPIRVVTRRQVRRRWQIAGYCGLVAALVPIMVWGQRTIGGINPFASNNGNPPAAAADLPPPTDPRSNLAVPPGDADNLLPDDLDLQMRELEKEIQALEQTLGRADLPRQSTPAADWRSYLFTSSQLKGVLNFLGGPRWLINIDKAIPMTPAQRSAPPDADPPCAAESGNSESVRSSFKINFHTPKPFGRNP